MAGQPPEAVLDRLQQDVLRHVGHALDDDAAMLLLRREPDLIPPNPGVAQPGTAGARPPQALRDARLISG
jgi:hypothetical protein